MSDAHCTMIVVLPIVMIPAATALADKMMLITVRTAAVILVHLSMVIKSPGTHLKCAPAKRA
jgi:hypothetical protein